MGEVFESVLHLLDECNLKMTARVMRRELRVMKDIELGKDKERHVMGSFPLTRHNF